MHLHGAVARLPAHSSSASPGEHIAWDVIMCVRQYEASQHGYLAHAESCLNLEEIL